MDDKFLKTSINDDLALQFGNRIRKESHFTHKTFLLTKLKCKYLILRSKTENDLIRIYKNKLNEAESKVEELTDIVGKLRYECLKKLKVSISNTLN